MKLVGGEKQLPYRILKRTGVRIMDLRGGVISGGGWRAVGLRYTIRFEIYPGAHGRQYGKNKPA